MNLVKELPSVVIGESVTTLIEGEPLCHPQLLDIVQRVRARFPSTVIKLTTNGVLLTRELIAELAGLKPIELTLSLNSTTPAGRRLLGLPESSGLLQLLPRLGDSIPWHGSMVAMPRMVGEDDLRETMEVMCSCSAGTVRVFIPGFTRLAPPELLPTLADVESIKRIAQAVQYRYGTPVVVEPEPVADLDPYIQGTISGSPARQAGLMGGELITAVNGVKPQSRVHAFNMIENTENPLVKVKVASMERNIVITKVKGIKSGLVMQYDIAPLEIQDLRGSIEEAELLKKRVVVLTSALGMGMVSTVLRETTAQVARVDSRFFGGNIATAGLLTVQDFAYALEKERRLRGALVILPNRAFDIRGRDLALQSYMDLQDFGCRVVLV